MAAHFLPNTFIDGQQVNALGAEALHEKNIDLVVDGGTIEHTPPLFPACDGVCPEVAYTTPSLERHRR